MIPFIDLKAQFKHLEKDIRAGIDAVLEHGQFILGPEVTELEKKLADFAGVKHAITCSSGTDALLIPMMAKNIGPGDLVFTTPFTFIATGEVISLLGATPVFVDIDPVSFNMDPDKLELAIKAAKAGDPAIHPLPAGLPADCTPKAVIPVDLFGLPADYDRIMAIAEKEGLLVIEDTAQGFGGIYKDRPAGSLADVGATSFFPAKPLGCYGDGGAIFTDDQELAGIMESIRVHGYGQQRYDNVRIGLNGRFDTLQAAVLIPKLKVFPEELVARQRIADQYTDLLLTVPEKVTPPTVSEGLKSAWAQYSLICKDRDTLQKTLNKAGIPTMVYYPIPLHLQTAYSGLGYEDGDLPVSENASRHILSLPMHPYLSAEVVETIARVIINS
jgi:dTDP-4-amino-4,6-dideoxygalactose transaminase